MSSADQNASTGGESPARRDLLSGSRLLELLSNLIDVHDSPSRATSLVVAAPHHAPSRTPLSGGHDVETGPVAMGLAQALSGKCVVAHELRTFVDLNKDPHEQQALIRHLGRVSFREADRLLKLYYQSQLFGSNPSTVIEVHGHVRGVFDIEVSAGCLLDDRVPQDRALAAALLEFKAMLVRMLARAPAFEEAPPTVGVYPLDRDVKFAATGTHTFNKVEKLRELGVNVAGLHIELGPELRKKPLAHPHQDTLEQLVACLAEACRVFVERNQLPIEFDVKEQLLGEFLVEKHNIAPLSERALVVQPLPKEQVGRRVAAFAPRDMERFGLGEGQSILLSDEGAFRNAIEVRAVAADKIGLGSVGIGKHLRTKLGRKPGDGVYAGSSPGAQADGSTLGYIASISEQCPEGVVHVGDDVAAVLARRDPASTTVVLRSPSGKAFELSPVHSTKLPHGRAVGLSVADARRLSTTFGDLACFIPT